MSALSEAEQSVHLDSVKRADILEAQSGEDVAVLGRNFVPPPVVEALDCDA